MHPTTSTRPTAHEVVFHQDRIDRRRKFLRDILLRRIGFGLLVKVCAFDVERVPSEGPLLVVMNHIAAIDPFVVTGAIQNRYVVPMSKVENTRHPIIGLMARAWGAYPVRRGEVDRRAIASTLELMHQGRAILLAPEGTRHPALQEAKHGMAYLATKGDAAVLPVGVEGTDRFPATLLRLKRTPVTVRFGIPFRFRTNGVARVARDDLHAMTQEAMYQLAALLPEARRGAYHDLAQATTQYLEFLDETV
ncbi:MAG: lysophospholipid acyltransferase family protein [Chloroflexota bacterium]|jgi:1-acyl-sn-glycerol-3-phosphate acyltransferase|nr:1-acyl-sn-glycerol-3-phosphate acyltransferase [Anaerolineae bacterium]HMM26898.1 lysophospholipid acyltransferase family protein [Aggregatilineaceae bacterium]